MTVQPGQKIASLPAQTAAKPGIIPYDDGGAQVAGLPAGGGTWVCNGATPVVIADARVTANSIIIFTLKTAGGTVSPNAPNVLTITPGTGFTAGGTAGDTSTYSYAILG